MEIGRELPAGLSVPDAIVKPLMDWYAAGRRILPWRENPTPYYVWVSEIMLQQTRVEAVKPYFERFISRLPDIPSLAAADEETLLKLWEGLGYYNRVRNLQRAAVEVMERFGGRLPPDYGDLLTLPGIGSYTAGAIASIAYGQPAPAVDGNVLRVLSRLRADDRDCSRQKTRTQVEAELATVIPAGRPGDFNQALMELGAVVCVPNGKAKCWECPLSGLCEAHGQDRVEQFPRKKSAARRKIEYKTVLILMDAEKAALKKRPQRGLLAGMYEFPVLEGHWEENRVLAYLEELGLKPLRIRPLAAAKHIFSHIEWHMIGYAVRVDEMERGEPCPAREEFIFAEPSQMRARYPIPTALSAYAKYLDVMPGKPPDF